jgi:thioredoxin-related protein
MKKLLFSLSLLMAIHLGAAELNWLTSVPEAQKKAKAENKMVLLDFTGSDWCGWCIKLKKEIFDTKEFAEYAKDNLVLVEIDFPQRKQQSDDLKKANAALQKQYKVRGFPTLIILDSEGKQLGELGYMQGGPQPFITRLNKLKPKAAKT